MSYEDQVAQSIYILKVLGAVTAVGFGFVFVAHLVTGNPIDDGQLVLAIGIPGMFASVGLSIKFGYN